MDWAIPEPCEQRWASMEPRGEGRFCRRCQHGVVDLSRMTRQEAEARIKSETGSYLCVRLAIDETDAALFRPEPSRARNFAGGLVLVAALTAAGCREPDTTATEAASIASEPCPVDGPLMMPVDPSALAEAEPVEDGGSEPAEVVPTEEQRELTRRKQQLRAAAAHPHPPIRHVLGRMPIRR